MSSSSASSDSSELPADIDVVVIGAGQAGLAVGQTLKQAGVNFVILDAANELGVSWINRWDSLQLFTSARFCGLPGLPFPGDPDRYPAKDEVPHYFRTYAATFELPVHLGQRVVSVQRSDGGFAVTTSTGRISARQVVAAVGAFQTPVVPEFSRRLAPSVTQLHSHAYRNPEQLPAGKVAVVGSANSGLQIATELSHSREVVVCRGRKQPRLPQRILGRDAFWWLSKSGLLRLPTNTPLARRLAMPDPVVGTKIDELARSVGFAERAVDADGAQLVTADGQRIEASTVLWATGYRNDWSWLSPELRGADGQPEHNAGIGASGLHFVGLYRMRNRGSALLGFVGRDAQRVGAAVARRARR
ncbi:NAD(P)/FAD-dependent oxidoreductase [Lysobacter firmicutimachus]|uniref:NAD(P)/FAD-dependent oxidoreductase n=1 Tax=Lysobacter firmicutimachus TaxID=1792846 RepID=A0ABU8D173_9GAMM